MQLLLQLQDVVVADYDDNGDHDDHEHEDGKDDQLPVHAWWQCNKSWTSSSELIKTFPQLFFDPSEFFFVDFSNCSEGVRLDVLLHSHPELLHHPQADLNGMNSPILSG